MENNKVLLLLQLINSLNGNFEVLEKSYNNQNKEDFDNSKKAILEIQKRINFILKKS
jgi:hypothetical protein